MEGDLLMKNFKEIKHLAEEAKKKEQEEKRFCKLCQKPETRSECSYGE
jgi:preprotein translocase subunit Sss1